VRKNDNFDMSDKSLHNSEPGCMKPRFENQNK